jgi:Cu-Zn family superoxide dismutase
MKKIKRKLIKKGGGPLNKKIENYIEAEKEDDQTKMDQYKTLYINAYARHYDVPLMVTIINPIIRNSFDKRLEDMKKAQKEEYEEKQRRQAEIIARNLKRLKEEEAGRKNREKSGAFKENITDKEKQAASKRFIERRKKYAQRGPSTLRNKSKGGKRKTKKHRKKHKKKTRKHKKNKKKIKITGNWSKKYKKNTNCKNPKGFSQKQHCNFGRVTRKAEAVFKKKNNVSGKVLFEQVKKGVKVTYEFKGLKNGKHGFHVHEKGNFKGDCNKAGPHFNPSSHSHAGRKSKERHIGDLGNVITKNSITNGSFIDKKISLKGKNNIIGRSLIVHDLKDDLGKGKNKESLKTGNAGARLNCAKILNLNNY